MQPSPRDNKANVAGIHEALFEPSTVHIKKEETITLTHW